MSRNLVKFSGIWSNSVQYVIDQMTSVAGIAYFSCPCVTYNGTQYIATNYASQPALGTAPNASSSWSVFSGSVVPNVAPVIVATTANLAALSGELTIDGVTTVSGNRVLVHNQTLSQNNGIYVTASGAWARSSDANSWADMVGLVVQVEQGSVQTGYIYASNAMPGGTLGTTLLGFTQVGVAESYVGSYPITVVGNTVGITHTNGFIAGVAAAGISDGAVIINAGSHVVTSNLTVNASSVSLPLNSSLWFNAVLDLTTSSASGATFTVTGTNCTVTTQAIAVGASVTNQYITLSGYIVTTGTASPSVAIVASSLTGTVGTAADSFITILQG